MQAIFFGSFCRVGEHFDLVRRTIKKIYREQQVSPRYSANVFLSVRYVLGSVLGSDLVPENAEFLVDAFVFYH